MLQQPVVEPAHLDDRKTVHLRHGLGIEIVQIGPHLVPMGADLPPEDDLSPVGSHWHDQLFAMVVITHVQTEEVIANASWAITEKDCFRPISVVMPRSGGIQSLSPPS